jgi:hypothetical protein
MAIHRRPLYRQKNAALAMPLPAIWILGSAEVPF